MYFTAEYTANKQNYCFQIKSTGQKFQIYWSELMHYNKYLLKVTRKMSKILKEIHSTFSMSESQEANVSLFFLLYW